MPQEAVQEPQVRFDKFEDYYRDFHKRKYQWLKRIAEERDKQSQEMTRLLHRERQR